MTHHTAVRRLTAVAAIAVAIAMSPLVAPAALAKGGGTGGGGGSVAPATLQADWPAAVPLPTGAIQATNGTAPSETVALVAEMSYPDVVSSVTALYTAGGFIQAADGTLVFSTSRYG